MVRELLALYKERFAYRGGEANELPKNDPGEKIRTETINALKKQIPPVTVAMVMRERAEPRETTVLLGGDYLRKGVRVTPGVLSSIAPAAGPATTRLDLARWIANERNPLFARVAVNRVWQRYFGLGIVETENDFGTQGGAVHRSLSRELADKLIAKKKSNPSIVIQLGTDPINTVYGVQPSTLFSRMEESGIVVTYTNLPALRDMNPIVSLRGLVVI